jgi:hypothetical protein
MNDQNQTSPEENNGTEKPATDKAPAKKAKKSKRLGEEQLTKLYPDQQIVPGSLRWLPTEEKQAVDVVCQGDDCEERFEVRTSDLFQSKRCPSCMVLARRARAKARRQEKKAKEAAEGK